MVLAVVFGSGMAALLAAFPLPVLAGMLAAAGLLHIGLLQDLVGARSWGVALLIGVLGFVTNLAVALPIGLALWWLPIGALRARRLVARGA